jgi:hypothetical protein
MSSIRAQLADLIKPAIPRGAGSQTGLLAEGYRDLWRYVLAAREAIMVARRDRKGGPHGGSALTAECDASGL